TRPTAAPQTDQCRPDHQRLIRKTAPGQRRTRHALVVMGVVVTGVAALTANYLLERLRPWQRLGG
ncbi:hypothetical protein AB0E76_33815, partial [Streptomyces fungicidicus]|uniref:hypothetical protein n=1 Tax=Streptomyces fungicidicus TaxID=68203 RepID=UPI0033DC44A6